MRSVASNSEVQCEDGSRVDAGTTLVTFEAPLRELLESHIRFARIRQSIDSGALRAVSVTASGYTSGMSVTFYEGTSDLVPWKRTRRIGQPTELTLNHLSHYNYHDGWQIPVAPEAYERDLTLFGDQYSNFNAGKILLYLEGLGGLDLSLPDRKLTVRPALPEAWKWMEIRLPIQGQWTRARYSHDGVQVEGCPIPWEVSEP